MIHICKHPKCCKNTVLRVCYEHKEKIYSIDTCKDHEQWAQTYLKDHIKST